MLTPSDVALAAMALTPGELLAKWLKSHKITPTQLGRRLGSGYLRVHRWTKDDGFGPEQRVLAATELGLPHDYFDKPTLDDEAKERERERRRVFADFVQSERGRLLARDYPEVMTALENAPLPVGWRVLSTDFFEGLALVYRGQLTRQEFESSLELNEQLSAEVSAETSEKRPFPPLSLVPPRKPK